MHISIAHHGFRALSTLHWNASVGDKKGIGYLHFLVMPSAEGLWLCK